jgi:hypothetical protein
MLHFKEVERARIAAYFESGRKIAHLDLEKVEKQNNANLKNVGI